MKPIVLKVFFSLFWVGCENQLNYFGVVGFTKALGI